MRQIVFNTNGPITWLAWLLTNILRPMLKEVPPHLENSMQLIETIQKGTANHTNNGSHIDAA